MRHLFYVLCLLGIIGCSGGIGTISDKASSNCEYASVTFIQGPLAEYVEVVKDVYPLEFIKNENSSNEYDGIVKAKFKFLKPFDVKVEVESQNAILYGTILDEKGIPLDFRLSTDSNNELETFLKKGYGEEWLLFTLPEQNQDIKDLRNILDKGRVILFKSETNGDGLNDDYTYSDSENESSEDANYEPTSTNGSTQSDSDCEKYIKGYERFVDRYIQILKKYKANPTDMSLISDYTEMVSEAEEWSSKAVDCSGDARFAAKIVEIQLKIANAASGL